MSITSNLSTSFVKKVFGPNIAVLCSQDAELVSKQNNLSFVELLQPFCTVNKENLQTRDTNGQPSQISDLHMSLQDLKCTPPTESQAVEDLHKIVEYHISNKESLKKNKIFHGNYTVSTNLTCPWFESYRNHVISSVPQRDKEYINHFVACLLVVSSSHPNPLEEFSRLSAYQNQIQHSTPDSNWKWMIPNTLKYFVLLHDNSQADISRAKSVFQELQTMYSSSCHLLQINSTTVDGENNNVSDHWSQHMLSSRVQQDNSENQKVYGCCMTDSDCQSISNFMYECASKSLIPHMEKYIKSFNTDIQKRNGLGRTFIKGFMRLGGSRASSSPSPGSRGDPLEQLRKAADLCFLCQLYENAYQFYHQLYKKELPNEKSWILEASAGEMSALSKFMLYPDVYRGYPSQDIDKSIDTYINRGCDSQVPLRCVLISLVCLSHQKLYTEAANQLLKFTYDSNEIKCAMLLEQVALCNLKCNPPRVRKYGFYMVLAGHRYQKVSKRCSQHCYSNALEVYFEKGWDFALDLMNVTNGRLCLALNKHLNALECLEQLVLTSVQNTVQQTMFYNEYLDVARIYKEKTDNQVNFRVPKILYKNNKVRFGSSKNYDEKIFQRLEVNSEYKLYPSHLIAPKKGINEVIENEEFVFDICFENVLNFDMTMTDVVLLFEYTTKDEIIESSMLVEKVESQLIKQLGIQHISFNIKPDVLGLIKITGVSYSLSSVGATQKFVCLPGVHMFPKEYRVNLNVVPSMPNVLVNFQGELKNSLKLNEIDSSMITLKNVGPKIAKNLSFVSLSNSCCLITEPEMELSEVNENLFNCYIHDSSQEEKYTLQKHIVPTLNPGSEISLKLWYQAMDTDLHKIEAVVYYENDCEESGNNYPTTRFTRFFHQTKVEEGVQFDCKTSENLSSLPSAMIVCYPSSNLIKVSKFSSFQDNITLKLQPTSTSVSSKCFAFTSENISGYTATDKKIQTVCLFEGISTQKPFSKLENLSSFYDKNFPMQNEEKSTNKKSLIVAVQYTEGGSVSQSYLEIPQFSSFSQNFQNVSPKLTEDLVTSENLEALHKVVKWTISCDSKITNNFTTNGACVVPVKIMLFNQYDCKLKVKLDASIDLKSLEEGDKSNTTGFAWAGKTLHNVKMEPCSHASLKMNAFFTRCGTYNLNSFGVWATPLSCTEESTFIPQNRQPPVMLSVCNEA